MNSKTRGLVWILALLGAALGGTAGYAFGWFVMPEIFGGEPLGDNSGPAWMTMWILAVAFGVGGAQWGRAILRNKRHKARKQARHEKYADQLDRFAQEKEAQEAAEAARYAQRRRSRNE